MMQWEQRWRSVERDYDRGAYLAAAEGFSDLAESARKPVDADRMRTRRADTLRRLGRLQDAATLYREVGEHAIRRVDRARASYDLARMVEETGGLDGVETLYRTLVLRFPDLMPGLRSLHHLERLVRAEGPTRIAAHLTWTREALKTLSTGPLGDNLRYFAISIAYERWRKGLDSAKRVETLLRRFMGQYQTSGLWPDAAWRLSFVYHAQARYEDELRLLARIRARRAPQNTLFGRTIPRINRLCLFRIAALQQQLGDYEAAARSYELFLAEFKRSRWRDDATFWLACVYLRSEQAAKASEVFRRLTDEHGSSKYLRRIPLARATPNAAVCQPLDIGEDAY